MRPFDARRCCLEMRTGAAATRFCVKTAAAEAGTSLERIARSSAPVFFKPQAVAAKRKPRGRDASERAGFMPRKSVVLARCCRKRTPILRNGRESMQLTYGLRAHGLAPVLAVSLFRRL